MMGKLGEVNSERSEYGLVSIIMPAYNTVSYIKSSIASVLSQTYEDWELIVVDDGSTDGTVEAVEGIQDGRVRLLRNSSRSGAAESRNRALREMRGRWVAFLDSDDEWLPEKLEHQLGFMTSNGYSFSYTDYRTMDEAGNISKEVITGPNIVDKRRMYCYCYPGALTVVYDTSVIGLVQVADIPKNNDYAMWLQVVEHSPAYRLPEILAVYRHRSGSISSGSKLGLIKHHYVLFHKACGFKKNKAFIYTMRNLFFGLHKKVYYKYQVPINK